MEQALEQKLMQATQAVEDQVISSMFYEMFDLAQMN